MKVVRRARTMTLPIMAPAIVAGGDLWEGMGVGGEVVLVLVGVGWDADWGFAEADVVVSVNDIVIRGERFLGVMERMGRTVVGHVRDINQSHDACVEILEITSFRLRVELLHGI